MREQHTLSLLTALLSAALVAACSSHSDEGDLGVAQQPVKKGTYGPGYNLHLEDTLRFTPLQPGADPDRGRRLFGVTADLLDQDNTEALFEGFSFVAQKVIVSNGRICFTCHRGIDLRFGMPPPPLSASVPLSDPLFTGIDGDAQGDPRAPANLENLGLIKYRPNRFNETLSQEDPLRQVLFWRKSPQLMNVAFSIGLLLDGRGRVMREVDQGAVFSHPQAGDDRFDDLFTDQDAFDLEAFQFSLVTDPLLLALRDTTHPLHQTLVDDPFYTVPVQTEAQQRGKAVFEKNCMTCHNVPNVFNNRANVEPLGPDGLSPQFPSHAPSVGRMFNVGVSERNKHGLTFGRDLGNGQFAPIIITLANEDGTPNTFEVTLDIGLAATTRRAADIGRFKVPQLRDIKHLAPYFHDNSAATLAEVIDYFNSDLYNKSADGKRFPIHLTPSERADLLEFLEIL